MRQPRQKFAAAEQASRYAVATPRFATDGLETLEQNGVENAGYSRDRRRALRPDP